MMSLFKGLAGRAVRHYASNGSALDPRRGWTMLQDSKVPAGDKVLALGLGVVLTSILAAAEVPLEFVVGLFVPMIGAGLDVLVDGAEMVIGPVLFASLLLPFLSAVRTAATPQRVPVESRRLRS